MIESHARLIYQIFKLSSNEAGYGIAHPLASFSSQEHAKSFVQSYNEKARKEGRNDEYFVREIVFYDE